jgi:hypothetical protein
MANITEILKELIGIKYYAGYKDKELLFKEITREVPEIKKDKKIENEVLTLIDKFFANKSLIPLKGNYAKSKTRLKRVISDVNRRKTKRIEEYVPMTKTGGGVGVVTPTFSDEMGAGEIINSYKTIFKGRTISEDDEIFNIIYERRYELQHRFSCRITLIDNKGSEMATLNLPKCLIEFRREILGFWQIGMQVNSAYFEGQVAGFSQVMENQGCGSASVVTRPYTNFKIGGVITEFSFA